MIRHFNAEAPQHLQEPSRSRRSKRKTSDLQEKILAAVQQEPGSTQTDLANALERSINTVRKNIYTLTHRGLVTKKKQGRFVHYYPLNEKSTPEPHLRVLLRDDRKKRIIDALSTHGDHTTINALATHLNEDYGLVKRTVETLVQLGYVRLEHEKHRRRIVLLPELTGLPGMTEGGTSSHGVKPTDVSNNTSLRAADATIALHRRDPLNVPTPQNVSPTRVMAGINAFFSGTQLRKLNAPRMKRLREWGQTVGGES